MIHMQRIPLPASEGTKSITLLEPNGSQAFAAFERIPDQISELLQRSVESYVNDDNMTSETGNFPARDRLASEFYVSEEVYKQIERDEVQCFWGAFFCACTEHEVDSDTNSPYLGLDVDIVLWPETGTLEVDMISSSSI